ncbi:RpoE-regulated lipoprotein [Martelella alba]|uniref:RpoE-regulated lipoprotein n=1 Tax=Martelella alba TaxID=2590451 RepID=A0ABY2SGB6_9HYPH|nr:RpoE-regulated lipoprotein [Martelella alba]TKI03221.1 RpoE-regulated lipoprotein [Martelella alba]
MQRLRPILIGLPLVLAGCSSVGFSWSSLSPFNWFRSEVTVTDRGVGGINAATPLTEDALDKALSGDYRFRKGMETANGGIVSFYQALKDKEVEMTIYGADSGGVSRVVVEDKSVPSAWGVKIGTVFSDLYDKAFGACRKGVGEDSEAVVCAAPQSRHVDYVFIGEWQGPESLMPADDVLRHWRVGKIIWHADTVH